MRLPTKEKQIATRLDDETYDQVVRYAYAKQMYVGELLRAALREYMLAHPMVVTELERLSEQEEQEATNAPSRK